MCSALLGVRMGGTMAVYKYATLAASPRVVVLQAKWAERSMNRLSDNEL